MLIVGLAAPARDLAQGDTPVPAVITLPAPTGPHAVGRTGFEWVDATRDEPFTDDLTDQP